VPESLTPYNTSASPRQIHERIAAAICFVACLVYAFLLWRNLSPFWFKPQWTTDDACQQLFPFHTLLHPGLFEGDLIYQAMLGYLAPLHYAVVGVFTLLTQSPIMAGHFTMALQLTLSMLVIFLAVRVCFREKALSWWYGVAPAFFAVLWLLHSRQLVQRMTAGLPRGWAPVIILSYLYFVLSKKHKAVLLALLAGCLLNPPAAFLCCAAYSLQLLYTLIDPKTRAEAWKLICRFAIAAPILAAVTLYVTARPASIGKVVMLQEAKELPEFQKAGGRFSFLPFPSIESDLINYSFRVFVSKLHKVPGAQKRNVQIVAGALLILCLAGALLWRKEIIPVPVILFAVAALLVYCISRPLAFMLYVPDRHLTYPIGLFFIIAFSVAAWRVPLILIGNARLRPYVALFFTIALAALIYRGHGDGLQTTGKGTANFNYNDHTRGPIYSWIATHTPEKTLIAGEPTYLDPVQLYGQRRGYATSETWHPFYAQYNQEMKRRLEITFRAMYARSPKEFVDLLSSEGVHYFVFDRQKFRGDMLKQAHFFEPINQLVQKLAALEPEGYLFYALRGMDSGIVPYQDKRAILVDVDALAKSLQK